MDHAIINAVAIPIVSNDLAMSPAHPRALTKQPTFSYRPQL